MIKKKNRCKRHRLSAIFLLVRPQSHDLDILTRNTDIRVFHFRTYSTGYNYPDTYITNI